MFSLSLTPANIVCQLLYLMYLGVHACAMSVLYCWHQMELAYHAVLKANPTDLGRVVIKWTLTFDLYLVLFDQPLYF